MTRGEVGLLAAVAALGAFVVAESRAVKRLPTPPLVATAADLTVGEHPSGGGAGGIAGLARTPGASADVKAVTRYSSNPPPVRDPEDVRRRLALGAAGTHIASMLLDHDSSLARWPSRDRSPLRVWVQPLSDVPSWRPEYITFAREAFDRWIGPGVPLRVSHIVDSATADIHVVWIDRFGYDHRIGNTRRVQDQHMWIVDATVTIATLTMDGKPLPPAIVRSTALHEVGHLLGLGHVTDTTSIMASRAYPTSALTRADLATLRLLYTLPPGRVD